MLAALTLLVWIRPATLPGPPPIPLRAKLGQMLLVCFEGTSLPPSHPLLLDIRDQHLGGVMLRNLRGDSGNIANPRQLRLLTRSLQKASPTPLLIAVDQEGGRVRRLQQHAGFPATVSFAELGRIDDPVVTYQHASLIAAILHQAGINFNFSPVVDLNSNPTNPVIGALGRSFSADPERVTVHGRAVVTAHRRYGIATCLKHFPGHGSSTGDSHSGRVDVTATWTEKELRPFADLIRDGRADAIMTAHIFNARLDAEFPATLSRPILTGLLRETLSFDGVIISDDLRMAAIAHHYPFTEVLERAVTAGVDILLLCDTRPQTVAQTIALLEDLVARGRISEQRIDQAYRRISRLKATLGVSPATGHSTETHKNPPSM